MTETNEVKPKPEPEMDWKGDIELRGVWFQSPMSGTGGYSAMVGQNYSTSMSINGIIKRVTLLGGTGGLIRATIESGGKLRYVIFIPGGSFSEVAE